MADNHFKIHNGATLAPQAAEPSNPTDGDMYYDATLNKFRKYENGSWSDFGSGSGSGINYITNPDFETSTTGWTAYDDGASADPVDGTGGSPVNVAIGRDPTASAVIAGNAVGYISKAAVNAQGLGVSTDFTIYNQHRGKVLYVIFDYYVANPANYTSGDFAVYIYDVTNANLIGRVQNDDNGDILNSGSNPGDGKFIGRFQTASDSTEYRLIIHNTSTTTLTQTIRIDNVKVSPDTLVPGDIVPKVMAGALGTSVAIPSVGSPFILGTAVSDPDGIYNPSTGIFTLTESGWYEFAAEIMIAHSGTTGQFWNLALYRNAVVSTYQTNIAVTSEGGKALTLMPVIRYFDAGDTAYIGNLSNNFTSPTTNSNPSHISCKLVRRLNPSALLSTTETLFTSAKTIINGTASFSQTTSGSYQKITGIGAATKDNTNSWDSANDRYVVSKDGDYFVGYQLGGNSSAASRQVRVYINSVVQGFARADGVVATFAVLKGAGVIPNLKKGDILEFYYNQATGGTEIVSFLDISIEHQPDFSTFSVYNETQFFSVKQTSLTAYPITVGQYGDLASLTLPPGKYDISALVSYVSNGATTTTVVLAGISETPGNSSLGLESGYSSSSTWKNQTNNFADNLTIPRIEKVFNTTTTIYLKGLANTSTTNLVVVYSLTARKIS